MERTSYSKLSQRDVDRAETDLLINLSTLTQRGLAKMIGCHESKISRTDWRFIASVLCAFGMASDISPISRAFKYALDEITKKKSPAATEDFKQIDMQFEGITGSIHRSNYDKTS
ncbi:CII family transcriptional regulator [Escherichia coli O5:H32]